MNHPDRDGSRGSFGDVPLLGSLINGRMFWQKWQFLIPDTPLFVRGP